jgi:hypothetical protein
MTDDPTNAARQARFRKMRALGYEHVSGWLPPKLAAKFWRMMAETDAAAERAIDAEIEQKVTRMKGKKE